MFFFKFLRNGDTESSRRREMQIQELENLKRNEERLNSLKKVLNYFICPGQFIYFLFVTY